MKLFFIVDNNEPHASGGGYYAIFMFASALARKGHQVFIYAVYDLGWLTEHENIHVYYRHTISRKNLLGRKVDKAIEKLSDHFILPNLLRKFQPDWLLGVLKESAIKAVRLGKENQVPVANFIYECPPWLREIYGEEAYQAANKGDTKKLWAATKEAYLDSQVLFPNSMLSQSYNRDWLGGRVIAAPIYPGVDSEQMPFSGETVVYQQKSVLFVGRLVAEKNVHLLIQAWQRMPEEITLNIVGTGPLMASLKEQASSMSNIVFHGYVADSQLWVLFRSTTMLVCPTQFEGFGMPPMQSLYFEKPCLASDLPILQSIYGDYIDYFTLGDELALANGMKAILADDVAAQQKGRAGREFILQNFTWNGAADEIVKTLGCN